ncbi:MAG: RNA polymerase sigma factor [Anaerolineales bacterium]
MASQRTKPEFADLVEAHAPEIHAFVWRMLREDAESEDVLQSAFLRAFRAYDRLPAGANYRAWLYRIAGNEARTQLRRRSRRPAELTDDFPASAPSVENQAELRIWLRDVAQAVEGLPHKQQTSLILRKYQGLSYPEIGEILEVSPEAARANVYQALLKLRNRFVVVVPRRAAPRAESPVEKGVRW